MNAIQKMFDQVHEVESASINVGFCPHNEDLGNHSGLESCSYVCQKFKILLETMLSEVSAHILQEHSNSGTQSRKSTFVISSNGQQFNMDPNTPFKQIFTVKNPTEIQQIEQQDEMGTISSMQPLNDDLIEKMKYKYHILKNRIMQLETQLQQRQHVYTQLENVEEDTVKANLQNEQKIKLPHLLSQLTAQDDPDNFVVNGSIVTLDSCVNISSDLSKDGFPCSESATQPSSNDDVLPFESLFADDDTGIGENETCPRSIQTVNFWSKIGIKESSPDVAPMNRPLLESLYDNIKNHANEKHLDTIVEIIEYLEPQNAAKNVIGHDISLDLEHLLPQTTRALESFVSTIPTISSVNKVAKCQATSTLPAKSGLKSQKSSQIKKSKGLINLKQNSVLKKSTSMQNFEAKSNQIRGVGNKSKPSKKLMVNNMDATKPFDTNLSTTNEMSRTTKSKKFGVNSVAEKFSPGHTTADYKKNLLNEDYMPIRSEDKTYKCIWPHIKCKYGVIGMDAPSKIKIHYRKHYNDELKCSKPFDCPECGRQFRNKRSFKQHNKRFHKI